MEALALCVDSLPDLWIQVPVVVTYLGPIS
jgi:hypothetical protein